MDTDLLKTFLEVNATRHFGRAADNLYLTPAAVSARVRQLEHSLGVALFIRTRNNIQLTPEGERLVPHAETLLLAWTQARQDVAQPPDQGSRLTVGATGGLWQFALAQHLSRLYDLLPELALRVEAHPADLLARRLEERALDLALLPDPPTLAGFRADRIGQIRLVLLSTDPDASPRNAVRDGYVHVDWGDGFEEFFGKRFGDTAQPVLHTNLGSVALDYLHHQKQQRQPAAAWLPQSVLERPECEGWVQVKGVPSFSRPVHAVYRTGTERRDAIAAFVSQLKPLRV